ncbi:MAG: peptidase M23 [Sulfurimonas sp. RIFOXYD12_FULL_33_39]|uniref:murein hydrolase activator EnvC family protein n=1 Tax=unclassified Sulfurimonas TaxID=2623549 RepID=UPI0008D34E71|nr:MULTISPECIES: peptidoglycan DD-metalloendopeptidase family protein [unclassified Sulfurimonas]OHE08905.1 MAG: peptidase M23 [Sulfurimonas sp. RIFOXYD12_FULL_33_39]OHE14215.1 MAG: peptidase M23 [Sulfurimonas sp. RIFOXYD2_FULL_34_21]DAB27981.1 MAG TPA: peptidase M23 [Sulfurimonas sp. UBA10385]
MIRLLIIFIAANLYLQAKTSVDTKIEKTNSTIDSYAKTHEDINKKMDETAEAILLQEKEIQTQQERLKRLKEELLDKENSHQENITQLKELKKSQNELKKDGNILEEELVFTIAQSISLSIILEEEYSASEESLIEYEVLELMLKNAKAKIKKLNESFYNNSKNIDILNQHVSSLEVAIATIDTKRKDLTKTQRENEESLKNLKTAKASYKTELKDILNKQDQLKETLAQLNIIKIDELRKAKEEAERAQAFDSKDIIADDNLPKVKKVGSSYQAIQTKEYHGEKTIAPFSPYKITKSYGNYTDPIYGIKVFNESISLKPNEKNVKVKTVFNGKVIYADKTPVLNNIVIIEHDDGLHTIYANLSQISPEISKGKKIKKGYTIGRVNDELIFEVTQKSFHINPIRLFQ